MDFEQELKRVAGSYASQGYQVTMRPQPEDLPAFAKDFKIELLARRGSTTSLVAVRKNLAEVSADPELSRYAQLVGEHPGWRLDLVVLEGEGPLAREARRAEEPAEERIAKSLDTAHLLAEQGHLEPALAVAWAGFEAAMRRRLLAAGGKAGWGTSPREMLRELYSAGTFSADEFHRLEMASRLRDEVVRGFVPEHFDKGDVQFLNDMARRLLKESQPAKQTA
jgi:hypothetical protein